MSIEKNTQAQQFLKSLPYFPLQAKQIEFICTSTGFKKQIIELIRQAKSRIYMTLLYWQNDEAGQEILDEIYHAKINTPSLDVKIFVDWHRAQRNLLGAEKNAETNADWYYEQRNKLNELSGENIFFGVPINTREIFGVLHIKGFVFDDTVLYSGASINNVYLNQNNKYRFDRYHKITHPALAESMSNFIIEYLFNSDVVRPLDNQIRTKTKEIRSNIRAFRKYLANNATYSVNNAITEKEQLSISPLFGLSNKNNQLNTVIENLFDSVQEKLTICTPYFNFPNKLQQSLANLLESGKKVEIIVGDKIANDFYVSPSEPFKMASALPYLYESNLRAFSEKFDAQIKQQQLIIRTWKDVDNTYHLKGVWVDNHYILLTGNNLNPRAWRLDAENGLFIYDPKQELLQPVNEELEAIRKNTVILGCYTEIEELSQYPEPVQKLLKKFSRLKADKLVKMIL
ncbi:CDP-diacylglycerol--serine O-phosphatidyltransferase [Bisgaardia hudsonensis]|uniref:CDP-diacylglycerol--serine O-phosphatidyltransferase n=1 Tax=Bisgaardia hudsonensis TaxID=109472 RepID=A0A4V2SIZ9_9PAST|nr:CDP-diacylglycerol--serine O-phosphatidyltransferase [Bisgaardia hudsonensis]QLB12198.1 phosphatidylserine synthase [Bisgaardia hudsonensis]TCP12238.1 CDP-diacylglycerol--serine O-phosphatidyltransferase [Bisgaardia hudsonensis]